MLPSKGKRAEIRATPQSPTWYVEVSISDILSSRNDNSNTPSFMASDDEDSWIMIENSSENASNVAADAALLSLSQNKPRQALINVLEANERLSLRVFAGANARLRKAIKLPDVIYDIFDRENIDQVEKTLAAEDAEASSISMAEVTGTLGEDEPEQYSTTTTQALHTIFHEDTFLPCDCHHKRDKFHMLDKYSCALRLDGKWKVSGDETHCFFDSVVAGDEGYEWRHFQFQIPRVNSQIRFHGFGDKIGHDTTTPTSELLTDFCRVFESHMPCHSVPIRIDGVPSAYRLYELTPIFVDDCPEDQAPISLFKALRENLLSAKSKIHLAFALSKSFWQYYESDWMQAAWNFETIRLLPQQANFQTLNAEAKAPFLAIRAMASSEPSLYEYERFEPSTRRRRLHQYPYILKLCFLLVLLCTETSPTDKFPDTIDGIYCFCVKKVRHQQSDWPVVDLPDIIRQTYKYIVGHCLPTACQDIRLSVAERRDMLRDDIVRPLHKLLRSMGDPDTDSAPVKELGGMQSCSQADGIMNNIQEGPLKASRDWLEKLATSTLYKSVSLKLRGPCRDNTAARRPRVAIIDTGYDPTSSFLGNPQKNRLNLQNFKQGHERYHWKDFWGMQMKPLDDDGHGTAILSVIMRIAPFADVCIARIAGSDQDLGGQTSDKSQKNLAEAIWWAVNIHRADIISMSLGWEQEHRFEDRYVVRNAISDAMTAQDQKVLFFAAASNFGGGKHELFPARHPQVFSVRATDSFGKHPAFNASLPEETEVKVYGTLGVSVPTARRGGSEEVVGRTGTSPATAVAAGLAALVIGYINAFGEGRWDNIRTQDGFQRLLRKISTEPEARKCFITLENVHNSQSSFEMLLDNVCWASQSR
ncbi:Nn.00g024030.m01.CDS01 [Neocucurbitaria sp. VM-36]